MKNILFIAYEFPPINRGGTQRPLKFVKYLSKYGLNPIVITLAPESYPIVYDQYHLDEDTTKEIKEAAEVIYVESENILERYKGKVNGFLSIYFSLIQREAEGWKPFLLPTLDKLIHERNIEAIFATVPPFSIAPLACDIAEKFKLPLILDFRDAWSQWLMQPYGSYFHYKLLLKLEKNCLLKASAIIATSDQTIADFKLLHPEVKNDKFHLIPNGYDVTVDKWETANDISREKFIIGYVGSFYYHPVTRKRMFTPWWKKKGHHVLEYAPKKEDWLYRSPYFFLKALARLKDKDPITFDKVEVVFAGLVPDWLQPMIQEFELQDHVKLLGRVSHKDSLKFQQSCDALLITSSKVVGGEDYSIAGKTFEYMIMNKPILAFVSDGAQKRLLENTGLTVICNPDDSESSSEKMIELIDKKLLIIPNIPFLQSFHRKALTEKLANVIKTI